MSKTILLALGGNAILQPKQQATFVNQLANVVLSAKFIAKLITESYRVVITHGNGPQIGNLLRQNEEARDLVPPLPLDVLSAQSQGFIGYMIQQCLANELRQQGIDTQVVCMVSTVEVDAGDPAFRDPAKPVGMFYDEATAKKLAEQKKWILKPDAGRGWRRMLPSPEPIRIMERTAIMSMINSGFITIACGGGGIPVVRSGETYVGVEGVIDKDLSASLLAREIKADMFLMVTDVENVYINYGNPQQKALSKVTIGEMKEYHEAGQFSKGSMCPKIRAALRFSSETGHPAIICALDKIDLAVEGKSGTRIA